MAYLAFGVLFAVAFNVIAERIANPEPIDYWISLVIGVLLLWMAWRSRSTDSTPTERSADAEMSLIKALSMGGVINLVGIPFALPYFAAIDQVLKADLGTTGSLSVVILYNIAYALPFLVVPLLALVMGEASRPVLARISNKVDRISAVLMPVMLLLVGLFLIVDAVSYFTTGEGLI
jgi:cytochrome c biogenesis protein CcdA